MCIYYKTIYDILQSECKNFGFQLAFENYVIVIGFYKSTGCSRTLLQLLTKTFEDKILLFQLILYMLIDLLFVFSTQYFTQGSMYSF